MRDFSKSLKVGNTYSDLNSEVKNEDAQKLEERKKYLEWQIRGLSKNEDLLNDGALMMLKRYKEEYETIKRKLKQMK